MKTIIITGPSGSGKSSLTNKLSKIFKNSIIIKTDSYYRDNLWIRILSIFIFDIYDRPLSIKKNELICTLNSIYNKNKLISFCHYDFEKKSSSKSYIRINYKGDNQFLILEGVFSHCLDINYHNSINIVCKEEKGKCFKRRLIRDQLERGRKKREVKKKFNKSWYLFYKNIKTFICRNKVIILNPSDKNSYKKLINNLKRIKKN